MWRLFNSAARRAPWPQAMAAMGKATDLLEKYLDTFTTGQMGILVRPASDQDGEAARAELERALGTSEYLRTEGFQTQVDSSGFPWVVLRAGTLPVLTAAAQAAGSSLIRLGIGPRVIAGVFPFTWKERRIYWLYQPRLMAYTPFAPFGRTEAEDRDHPLEVRMADAMRKNIPVAKDISQWYPVWDVPV